LLSFDKKCHEAARHFQMMVKRTAVIMCVTVGPRSHGDRPGTRRALRCAERGQALPPRARRPTGHRCPKAKRQPKKQGDNTAVVSAEVRKLLKNFSKRRFKQGIGRKENGTACGKVLSTVLTA